ncbi:hypothetical protein B0H14DRAFT_761679 [Mycena olivaceomarginata]|nr:hypothetical protein B0H14DRAFT_761679 [Mycena olivaceomarginata]
MHDRAHVWKGQCFHCHHSMPCLMRNNCAWRLVSGRLPIPSTSRCHIVRHRVAQHPARSSTTPSVVPAHQWTIRAPDDRRTHPPMLSPSYIVSLSSALPSGSQALDLPSLAVSTAPSPPSVSPPCYLHPCVDFSACRVSIHTPQLQQPLSPHPTTLLPQYLQRAPAHSPLARASYNTPSKRSKHAQNTHVAYNELVASATPTTSLPHPPPRSRPRPAPGHHDLATQALATRRARPISTSIRFFGDCFLHTSALSARPAHLPAPSQRGLDAYTVLAQRLPLLPPLCVIASFTMLLPCSAATPRDTVP